MRLWNYHASRPAKTYTGHVNRTYCIPSCFATSRMGERLVLSGSEDARVYIWDLQSRQLVQVLEGHKDVVLGVSVSHYSLFEIQLVDTVFRCTQRNVCWLPPRWRRI